MQMSDSEDEIFFGPVGIKELKIIVNKPHNRRPERRQTTIGFTEPLARSTDIEHHLNSLKLGENKENVSSNFIEEVTKTLFKDEPVPDLSIINASANDSPVQDLSTAVLELHKEIDEKFEQSSVNDNYVSIDVTDESTRYFSIKVENESFKDDKEKNENIVDTILILDDSEEEEDAKTVLKDRTTDQMVYYNETLDYEADVDEIHEISSDEDAFGPKVNAIKIETDFEDSPFKVLRKSVRVKKITDTIEEISSEKDFIEGVAKEETKELGSEERRFVASRRTAREFSFKFTDSLEKYEDSLEQKEEISVNNEIEEIGEKEGIEEVCGNEEIGGKKQIEEIDGNKEIEEMGGRGKIEETGKNKEMKNIGEDKEIEELGETVEIEEIGEIVEIEEIGKKEEIHDIHKKEETKATDEKEVMQKKHQEIVYTEKITEAEKLTYEKTKFSALRSSIELNRNFTTNVEEYEDSLNGNDVNNKEEEEEIYSLDEKEETNQTDEKQAENTNPQGIANDSFQKLLQNESFDNCIINNEIKSLIDTLILSDEEGGDKENRPEKFVQLSTISENDASADSSHHFNDTLEDMEMFMKECARQKELNVVESTGTSSLKTAAAANGAEIATENTAADLLTVKEEKHGHLEVDLKRELEMCLEIEQAEKETTSDCLSGTDPAKPDKNSHIPVKRYFPTPTKNVAGLLTTPKNKKIVPATKKW